MSSMNSKLQATRLKTRLLREDHFPFRGGVGSDPAGLGCVEVGPHGNQAAHYRQDRAGALHVPGIPMKLRRPRGSPLLSPMRCFPHFQHAVGPLASSRKSLLIPWGVLLVARVTSQMRVAAQVPQLGLTRTS